MITTTNVTHISSPDSEEMITDFIANHPQGVLTTINKAGVLQGSAINVFQIDNYHLAFMTKKSTRKSKNIALNPIVSFVTYDPFSRTEAAVEGVAQQVHDRQQIDEILEIIKNDAKNGRRHISPYVTPEDDFSIFIIYPRNIHMTTYWERDTGIETFHESIEFDLSMKA